MKKLRLLNFLGTMESSNLGEIYTEERDGERNRGDGRT
jgi:hypothetical protein